MLEPMVRRLPCLLTLLLGACVTPAASDTDGDTTTAATETEAASTETETGEPGPYEGWCEACVDPGPGGSCANWHDWVITFAINYGDADSIDQICEVVDSNEITLRLACETFTQNLTVNLEPEWPKTVSEGDFVRLTAERTYYEDWQLGYGETWMLWDSEDQLRYFFYDHPTIPAGTSSAGATIESVEAMCQLECREQQAYQDRGVAFSDPGETLTLFAGEQEYFDTSQVWVLDARQRICDMIGDTIHDGRHRVFRAFLL
jgi:hypothetical protein